MRRAWLLFAPTAIGLVSCGSPAPHVCSANAVIPAAAPQTAPRLFVDGLWVGVLHTGRDLRMQFHLDVVDGSFRGTLDSLDEDGGMAVPCANVAVVSDVVTLDVPSIFARVKVKLSTDGNTLDGVWTQGGTDFTIALNRQSTALGPAERAYDPEMAPVAIADLPAVLDRDLAVTLHAGPLAPSTNNGVTIGVLSHGAQLILSYGAAKKDSVFEIGSITKTFTGLLLAQMTVQKTVTLDEQVRALLPAGTVPLPTSGAEISLLDLSTHHSGLPRMPDNFAPADPKNPYADYDTPALYAFLATHGVGRPEQPAPLYSNLGVGLLGQALAERAHSTYEALLRREITSILGMPETRVTLSPSMRARLLPGYDASHQLAHQWDFDALAGAGGIRSTASDMLIYLRAQLHPEDLPASVRANSLGRTLPAALKLSHDLHGSFGPPGTRIALGWMYIEKTETFWHDGGTAGFSSYASFNPEQDFAVVVLFNNDPDASGLADALGRHVEARLQGLPARSLGSL